jgi:ribonuclease I
MPRAMYHSSVAVVIAMSVAIRLLAVAAEMPGGGRPPACPASSATAPNSSREAPSIDMLVLAMQWPFSTCLALGEKAGASCRSPVAAFVVRGLWAMHAGGQRPRCCFDNLRGAEGNLSLTPISDLAPQLQRMWPDLTNRESAIEMWNREWQNYGSCSGMPMRQYFRKTLELSRRFDILRELYAERIYASSRRNAQLYSFERVQHAVDSVAGGARVRIRCHRSTNTSNDSSVLLDEVLVCMDTRGIHTVDCPDACFAIRDGEQCCDASEFIRIPFWSHEKRHPNGVSGDNSHHHQPLSNSSSNSTGSDASATDTNGSSLLGQVIGISVVVAGVAFYLFKQCFEQRTPVTAFVDYQRIP